jgi:Domain of unknown function (DUF1905)/Bacteriocin-protection, YdeI or OmpD-Associated
MLSVIVGVSGFANGVEYGPSSGADLALATTASVRARARGARTATKRTGEVCHHWRREIGGRFWGLSPRRRADVRRLLTPLYGYGVSETNRSRSPAGRPLVLTAVIELTGINPYVRVQPDQSELLKPGWRRPMPVVVRIDGDPDKLWPTNMMPVGKGAFNLYLHGEMRKASQTAVGDIVALELWFDEEYVDGPQHPLPPWFETALGRNGAARANWERLPPSRRKELLRYFDRLKSDEAIERNLNAVLHVLAGNTGHYMGRDWADGK